MSDIKSSINYIYRINDYKFFSFDDFYESYGFNILIIMFFLFVTFYLLMKIELKVYRKNWASLKCNPKYLYVSGFIQREGNLGPINSTFYNYNDCIQQGVSHAIDEMNAESQYHTKKQIDRIDFTNKKINDNYKKYNKDMNEIKNKIELPEDINEKLKLTIDSKSAGYYSQLKNIGIYIDQIDATFSYFYQYVRNYLSYLYFTYKKDGDQDKASNTLSVLNKHFGGINF